MRLIDKIKELSSVPEKGEIPKHSDINLEITPND